MAKSAAERMAEMRDRRRSLGMKQVWLTPNERALIDSYREYRAQGYDFVLHCNPLSDSCERDSSSMVIGDPVD